MKAILLPFLFLLYFSDVTAQILPNELRYLRDEMIRTQTIQPDTHTLRYDEIEGNPYWNKDFIPGKIYIKGKNYPSVPLRLNLYEDNMEYKAMEKGEIYILTNDIDSAIIGNEKFINLSQNPKSGSYFCLRKEGEIKLLEKKTVGFVEPKPPKPYSNPDPAKFEKPKTFFYILDKDSSPMFIKNKKSILKIFPTKKKPLEVFLKEHKIRFTEANDLILLCQFLEQPDKKD